MYEFFSALLTSAVLVLGLMKLSGRIGLVDRPGGRKSHVAPTPTVGGLAMFAAVAFSLCLGGSCSDEVAMLLYCAAALVVLGVLDDRHGLPVHLRMMIEVVVVLLVILGAGGQIDQLGSLLGLGVIELGIFAIPFSVVALVGGINAVNMIDGADGMAGKMALITVLGVLAIALHAGTTELLPLVWAMLGALAGFLLFNSRLIVKRAWVFMGDAGSMWIGMVLAWLTVRVTRPDVGAEPALALWLLGIPLIDTLTVMARRMRHKKSPFSADRTHIHHLLEDAGLSVRQTVFYLSLVQAVLVGIAILFYLNHTPAVVVFLSFALLFSGYYYRLRNS